MCWEDPLQARMAQLVAHRPADPEIRDQTLVRGEPREGVIIECPLNDLFQKLVIDVLTSQTDVSEVVENVDNDLFTKKLC